jgi:general secretion pathway protein C
MSYPGAPSELNLVSAAGWIDELKSGQGLVRLFDERGAQIVAVALLLLLGLDSALIITRALDRPAAVPPSSAAGVTVPFRPAVNPTLQLAVIVNAHLFGAAGVTAGGEAPPTTMPLILAGVIAEKDPAKGQAIIGENPTAAKLYAVGGAIPGGAKLHAVYADRVLLERNGALEALNLPHSPPAGGIGVGPVVQSTSRLAAAASNPTLLAGLVRIQPVFSQGKLNGYRIFPGGSKGTAVFSQLGLRPGDLIEAVNGTALDDAARAMEVLQTLSSSASATVTVSRNGQSQEVNLNLAAVNIEPELGEGANSSASQEGGQPTAAPAPAMPPAVPGARFRGGAANLGAAPATNSTGSDTTFPGERER